MRDQKLDVRVEIRGVVRPVQHLLSVFAVPSEAEVFRQWGNREWGTVSLSEVFPISRLDMLEYFRWYVYLLPFCACFRIVSWMERYFDAGNAVSLVRCSRVSEFPE
jgi:hypothetical protein